MRRKLKFKRKYIISSLCILVPVILIFLVMNNSFSIWTANLNISGTATAIRQEQTIELSPVLVSTGKYTNFSGNAGLLSNWFNWNSDTIDSSNSLSTRITDTGYATSLKPQCQLTLTFNLKNTSSEGITYINGTTQLDTKSDPGSAISSNTCRLSKTSLSPGQQTTVTLDFTVTRRKLQSGSYLKYAIIYYVTNELGENIPYTYYYTVYISK